MLALFKRKRLKEKKLANIFTNSIFEMVDNGFADVAGIINDDATFYHRPAIDEDNSHEFLMIVLVGNLNFLSKYFDPHQEARLAAVFVQKFSVVFEVTEEELTEIVKKYKSFFARINHPSKNTLYAMSKAMFYKYELNQYQEDYFKSLRAPNPIFLKKMDEVMSAFLWDWEGFLDKYRITS